jgi:hypothetical protein
VLEDIDRHALFHEMHRSVEESASMAAEHLMAGTPDLTYPPNHGFLPDELAALSSLPRTPAMKRALRKSIASAAAEPDFHLFCLVDSVADPQSLEDVQDCDRTAVEITLHDGFYESYWAWRGRRPDPGWRIDTHEGE